MGFNVYFGIGIICLTLALIFSTVSFTTDNWVLWNVNRTALNEGASTTPSEPWVKQMNNTGYFFGRTVGLFRTCYPGIDSWTYISQQQSVTDTNCLYVNYELGIESNSKVFRTAEYRTAINLKRCQFATLALSLLLLVFGLVGGAWGCWSISSCGSTIAGINGLLATLMIGASLICFHVIEYLETSVITDDGFYNTWPKILKDSSNRSYDYSYCLAWVGFGLSFIATAIFLVLGVQINSKKKMEEAKSQIGATMTRDAMMRASMRSQMGMDDNRSIAESYQKSIINGDDGLVPVIVMDPYSDPYSNRMSTLNRY